MQHFNAAFARKDCHITANCVCVNQGKPSFEDWHVYIIVQYKYLYIIYILYIHYIYIYSFYMWRVSWQICVASLQESVRWVYRRFHRWCNNSWEDGRITSTKCTTNLCNMFFSKSIALLKKRRSATLLSSGPSTCAKTSLNTADQPLWIQQTIFLKNVFVCLRKSGGIYSGRMKTNGVFLLQDSFTLPYLSGLIWINLD